MATYDKETKFYYLQVKEDFFEDDAIEWLEDRPNGEKYSNFYMKLCLKSLKTSGILIKQVGEMLIPYNIEALSKLTKVKDIDTIKVAMDLLIKAGLVQMTEEHAIYISQIENLIGSKSLGALKKQQQRIARQKNIKKLGSGHVEDKCPPKIEIELKQELDIDLDLESEEVDDKPEENILNFLETNFGRTISPIEMEQVMNWQDDFNDEIIKYGITLCCNNNAKNINYLNAILNNWKSKGFKKLEECKDESLKRKSKSTNQPIRTEVVPEWLGKKIESQEPTVEEKAEMEEIKNFEVNEP